MCHRSILYIVSLIALTLFLPISRAFASSEDGEQQVLPPHSSGFGMGLLSINLIESIRRLGPVRGYHPELAPVLNPDAPEVVAVDKPTS